MIQAETSEVSGELQDGLFAFIIQGFDVLERECHVSPFDRNYCIDFVHSFINLLLRGISARVVKNKH